MSNNQDSPASSSWGASSARLEGWSEHWVVAPDGTRLYTRKRNGGSSLNIVLCDGIACDGFIWRYLQNDLTPLGNIVHWHYRGHGRSGAPAKSDHLGIDAFVEDLNAVRDKHASEKVLLIGHSMGCQVALEGYRSRPEQIAGIVLICGASGRLTHTFKGSDALAKALPKLIARVKRNPRMARALWSNVPPEISAKIALASGEVDANAIDASDIVAYSEHVANLDPLMFFSMLKLAGDASAEDMLPNIEVPVLIVAGQLDSFTPPHLAETMAGLIPNCELEVYQGATHVVPIERRHELLGRISAFVTDKLNAG